MGYVRTPQIDRVILPSDPNGNYWVEMRSFVFYGDQKAAANDSMRQGPNGQTEIDSDALSDNMLLRYISDWNLDDDQGVKLPISRDSLAKLIDADANALSARIAASNAAKDADRKN